ncbi:hypothetical protein KSW81_006703 [Nannochloris sp. 'desiccata']|nr:hypothetical protein KSW81_006703 [Chlorella desiccata (nom. nud.)]
MHRSTALAIKTLIEASIPKSITLVECQQLLNLRSWSSGTSTLDALRCQTPSAADSIFAAASRPYASLAAEAPRENRNNGPQRPRNPNSQHQNNNRGPPGSSNGTPANRNRSYGPRPTGGGGGGGGSGGNGPYRTGNPGGGGGGSNNSNFNRNGPSSNRGGPNDRGPNNNANNNNRPFRPSTGFRPGGGGGGGNQQQQNTNFRPRPHPGHRPPGGGGGGGGGGGHQQRPPGRFNNNNNQNFQQNFQQNRPLYRPRAPIARPVPWWEKNKVQEEQQAAQQAQHARQEMQTRMRTQRRTPKEPEAIIIPHDVTVLKLAQLFGVPVKDLEKVLSDLGEPPRSEQDTVAADAAELAALELGKVAVVAAVPINKNKSKNSNSLSKNNKKKQREEEITSTMILDLPPRPAVVTVMGHVDHGKTTLLDALRSTSVAAREAGGITQHVGAFEVSMPGSGQSLTFLDTPGHAAFTAMRARGAAVTDLVVLVVAADDGVMPQTKEALAHAQAAGCPIVVAITKCDMPSANPEKVRRQLASAGLPLEGQGGNVQAIEVASPTGKGLPELEEALLLEGEMLELTADPMVPATGTVIEAKLDRGQGPLATLIITRGTLKTGQFVVVGSEWGKIRALRSPGGELVDKDGVLPGRPVEIVGLKGLPLAGDEMMAVATEERAQRVSKARTDRSEGTRRAALARIQPPLAAVGPNGEEQRTIPIVVKADVQGSAEAVRDALLSMSSKEVRVQVVHAGVGPITLSDVGLAVPSGAKVIGFNVKVAADAEAEAKLHGVEVLTRRVIYELLGDVGSLIEGLTPRALEEVVVGQAQVLAMFKASLDKKGKEKRTIAGCRVGEGTMKSGLKVKVLRGGEVIAEGICNSLRRHKLDVDTVGHGSECGLGVEGFDDFQAGDMLHCVDEQ